MEKGTVNVAIFAQYIFSRILRRGLDAHKYDASKEINCYSLNRINCYIRENVYT